MTAVFGFSDRSEVDRLVRVVAKHPREAFVSADRIAAEWRALQFTAPPDLARAFAEYEHFLEILSAAGVSVDLLPPAEGVGLDSLYARDASVVTPAGMLLCAMGKPARLLEPAAQGRAFEQWGIRVAGSIVSPGRLEGGDVVWLDSRTVAVGRGYRTNAEGIRQFAAALGSDIACLEVPLPHWRGPHDVFHLMSILSPIAARLAVVYAPLLPVPFRERLVAMGYEFVEVPDQEFDSMGANVLAVAPKRCVMLEGNPETRRRIEATGSEVFVYAGTEISVKGGGGPTCLTRPVVRAE